MIDIDNHIQSTERDLIDSQRLAIFKCKDNHFEYKDDTSLHMIHSFTSVILHTSSRLPRNFKPP